MTVQTTAATTTGWRPDDSTFGARLAMVRQRMAWGNVKEAATACGLPAESWRTWERDNVQPRNIVEVAALIAERTRCDYGWLLAGQRLVHDQEPNHRWVAQSDRPATPRPNGHPHGAKPADATRRPSRIPGALTHMRDQKPSTSAHARGYR